MITTEQLDTIANYFGATKTRTLGLGFEYTYHYPHAQVGVLTVFDGVLAFVDHIEETTDLLSELDETTVRHKFLAQAPRLPAKAIFDHVMNGETLDVWTGSKWFLVHSAEEYLDGLLKFTSTRGNTSQCLPKPAIVYRHHPNGRITPSRRRVLREDEMIRQAHMNNGGDSLFDPRYSSIARRAYLGEN